MGSDEHNTITHTANLPVATAVPNHGVLEFRRTWYWSAELLRTEVMESSIEPFDGVLKVPDEVDNACAVVG